MERKNIKYIIAFGRYKTPTYFSFRSKKQALKQKKEIAKKFIICGLVY